MKKYLLFLILLPLSGISQEWAPIGATWYYTEKIYDWDSSEPSGVFYSTSESVKDTVILGKQCRKIMDIPTLGGSIHWRKTYTYESNDSIYFYHPALEKFCLLFDFGANVGDVWEIFCIPTNLSVENIDTLIFIVDSIEEVSISGKNFKGFHLSYTIAPGLGYASSYIIEGIGPIGGNIFPYRSLLDPWYHYPSGGLRCYITDSLFFHTGPYECDEVTTGLKNEETMEVTLYPNPVENILYLQNNANKNTEYEIYDLSGKMVKEGVINNQIDVSPLPKGIYRLFLKNNVLQNLKFVKL